MLERRIRGSIGIILLILIASSCTKSLDPKAMAKALNGVSAREADDLLARMGIQTKQTEPSDDSAVTVEAKFYEEAALAGSSPIAVIETGNRTGHWSYLFFRESGGRWSYVGDVDLPGQRAYKPVFRIKHNANGNGSWFVVRQLAGYGTGLFKQDEVWYRLSGSPIQEDLRYAVKSTDWMSPSELVFSKVTGYSSDTGGFVRQSDAGFSVEVQYHIEFTDSSAIEYENENDAFLFHAEKKIKYVWDEQRLRFDMDKSDSSYSDETLLEFTPGNMLLNFRYEIEQLGKSKLPVKQNWVKKLSGYKE